MCHLSSVILLIDVIDFFARHCDLTWLVDHEQTSSSAAMSSSKKSAPSGVIIHTLSQSSTSQRSANTVRQTPVSNVSSGMQHGSIVPGNQRPDYNPKDCLNVSMVNQYNHFQILTWDLQDIRNICKETQARIQALGQAIARQPGVPGSLTDLMGNDLRHIAQQFVSISFHCRMLENKLEERAQAASQERVAINVSHGVELSSFRRKIQVSQERISRLEQELHDLESSYGNADKRRKTELEKKTEKINNQKRRIKEQQDQIEVSVFPSLESCTLPC